MLIKLVSTQLNSTHLSLSLSLSDSFLLDRVKLLVPWKNHHGDEAKKDREIDAEVLNLFTPWQSFTADKTSAWSANCHRQAIQGFTFTTRGLIKRAAFSLIAEIIDNQDLDINITKLITLIKFLWTSVWQKFSVIYFPSSSLRNWKALD